MTSVDTPPPPPPPHPYLVYLHSPSLFSFLHKTQEKSLSAAGHLTPQTFSDKSLTRDKGSKVSYCKQYFQPNAMQVLFVSMLSVRIYDISYEL